MWKLRQIYLFKIKRRALVFFLCKILLHNNFLICINFIMKKLNKLFNVLNIFLLSLGSIIGVGFLSGAEIWSFFGRFGENFWIIILIVFVLMFVLCSKIIKDNCTIENNTIMQNFDKKQLKNTILIKLKIKKVFYNFEILLIASAMFAGLRNIIYELFKYNQIIIFLAVTFLLLLLLLKGSNALLSFNNLIMLGFFAVIVLLFFRLDFCSGINQNLKVISSFDFQNISIGGLLAITYVFMNIAHLVPIFKTQELALSKKGRWIFSLTFSLTLCLIILILVLFLAQNSYLTTFEMPILNFFQTKSDLIKIFFIVVLLGGLLSTLLVCLTGIKHEFLEHIKVPFAAVYLSVILPLILGFLPFSFFINFVYPFVGLLNFVSLIFL